MLYSYRCKDCDHITEARRSIARMYDCPECSECGGGTKKIIVPVAFKPVMGGADNPGYMCPVTDQWVDTERKRRNIEAEHDLVPKS